MNVLLRPVQSSLGSKYVMAVTGLLLIGFVLIHMAGNLLVFAGPAALNAYAAALKHNPGLLWTARTLLLLIFVIHIALGLRLVYHNRLARGQRYVYEDTVQASWASRHMLLTGLVLLAFVIYHIAHFTLGLVATANGVNYLDLKDAQDPARQNVYGMVISGFQNPWITLSYLVAMVFLWLHLWHGAYSWFQSLGINHPRYNHFLRSLGPIVSTLVLVGNCSMPLAIYFRLLT
jgi:succinate dehydrogenase / fumarate reductase cytochrome b subunit